MNQNLNNTQKSLGRDVSIPNTNLKKPFIERWKEGISNIPPVKLSQIAIRGSWITIIGIIVGIIITTINYKNYWWFVIILSGALINSITAIIGQYKQLWAYQKIDKMYEELKKIEEVKENV